MHFVGVNVPCGRPFHFFALASRVGLTCWPHVLAPRACLILLTKK